MRRTIAINRSIRILALTVAVAVVGTAGYAQTIVVPITTATLETHAPVDSTMGSYYTLPVEIPRGTRGKTLIAAFLEIYADVSAREVEIEFEAETRTYRTNSPVFEVFPLKEAYSGPLDRSKFMERYVCAEEVLLGNGRRIKIDLTEIVSYFVKNPSENHGLILGSFSGFQDGIFGLRQDVLPDNAVAQITYYVANL